jgi:Fe-S cluster assembly ATP-binding protein
MDNNSVLEIRNLHVEVAGNEVLKGVSLTLEYGKKYAIMGPNGSGKSSLANALSGHPEYTITSGEAYLDGKNILEMDAAERSLAGLFLAFQYPVAISGVSVQSFIRSAVKAHRGSSDDVLRGLRKEVRSKFKTLEMNQDFASRFVNDGFSGGEKKRLEVMQMLMLQPKVAILDEIDSGLDIDALKIVAKGINEASDDKNAILMVTHYQRILDYVKPDYIYVMYNGKIVKSGGAELALQLEDRGYDWIKSESLQEVEA